MRYMIFDSMGNAVDAFRLRRVAEAALRAIVLREPKAADELVLLAYSDEGRPVGEAVTFDDLPDMVRIESRFTIGTTSGLGRARSVIHAAAPEYIYAAARLRPERVVLEHRTVGAAP